MSDKSLENLKEQKENYRSRAFKMMLEIGLIIALPAIVAFFAGKYFDARSVENAKTYTLLLLGLAFILSWTIIIYKYVQFDKKVKEIDRKIRELKNKCYNHSSK